MAGWYPGKNLIEGIRGGLDRNKQLKERGMNTPAPTYDQGLASGFQQSADAGGGAAAYGRGEMRGAMGMYKDMAQGNGPSVAENQMRQGADQAIANQMTMGAMGSGGNLGSAMRGASAAGAGMNMQTNADAATLRAGEQQAAMAGYAGLASGYAQGGLAQQAGAQGLQGQMGGQQLAADTQWGLGQRGLDLEQLQGNRGFGLGVAQGLTGAAGTGASIGAMFSDMRAKESVAASGGAATEAARAAMPSTFEYVDGAGPPGRRAGVMAQGLASTPAGRATVTPDPSSGLLTVDPGQLSALSMAATSETVSRLDRIEQLLANASQVRGGADGVGREGFEPRPKPKKKKKKPAETEAA